MPRHENKADRLDQVFREVGSEETLRRREHDLFESLARGATRAVIFGSGPLGRIVLDGARASSVPVVAFADNKTSLQGTTLEGIPILSPAAAVSTYGHDAYFIVGVYNSSGPRSQLQELGCERIVPYPAFAWRFAATIPWTPGIDLPHRIVVSASAVRAAYDSLADDKSRTEFAAQIAWRCTLDYQRLPPPDPAAEIYFSPELIRLSVNEVLLDCGAFDGDSLRLFRDRTAGAYRHVYACEPDASNRRALERFIATLPAAERERVTVLPFAVGDRSGTVFFESSGTAGSHITSQEGAGAMESRRIDDLMQGRVPTMIKMDIEGAEPDALGGATAIIRSARPRLAVCAYHKSEHLWTLPTMMKAALPEYRISLRRYAEECWETVYYAVPPERSVDGPAQP